MNNPRMTSKERNALKGAIRRVFSRSDLRKAALLRVKVEHSDPSRLRVKTWYYCEYCGELHPQHFLNCDHIDPVIPIYTTFERMTLDQTADRTWCEPTNLQILCLTCHGRKSTLEKEERKKYKELK